MAEPQNTPMLFGWTPPKTKRCSSCTQWQPIELFGKFHKARDGLHAHCNPCRNKQQRAKYATKPTVRQQARIRHITKTYGLTTKQYNAMWETQDGKCAACSDPLDGGKLTHVDHCHVTGRVRAILCHHCNTAIGHARHEPDRLRAMIAYLERHSDGSLA